MSLNIVRPRRFRERVFQSSEGESMCERSHADSVNINNIVARFHRTGELPKPTSEPIYEDVTGLQGDYRERLQFLDGVKARVDSWYAEQARLAEAAEAPPPSTDTPPAS